ncbi:MAG: hypothetical protein M3Y55_07050 [Pseudomonadota bacterium]|nr:hypothetical protein [Pseudomonadota bacterium]MDQ2764819.1 hypothetical protein [Pseudomonadota bacterium]
MKAISLMSCCLILVASSAFAIDDMKKSDSMAKDRTMGNHTMTMQQCKDHMAMSSKAGMKKDDAMMKKDTMCADMMKDGNGMKKNDSMMKSDGMASRPK